MGFWFDINKALVVLLWGGAALHGVHFLTILMIWSACSLLALSSTISTTSVSISLSLLLYISERSLAFLYLTRAS